MQSPSDQNCCLDRAAVTMRGISARRVAALSQFTHSRRPKVPHTHMQSPHTHMQSPHTHTHNSHLSSPVTGVNCSDTQRAHVAHQTESSIFSITHTEEKPAPTLNSDQNQPTLRSGNNLNENPGERQVALLITHYAVVYNGAYKTSKYKTVKKTITNI